MLVRFHTRQAEFLHALPAYIRQLLKSEKLIAKSSITLKFSYGRAWFHRICKLHLHMLLELRMINVIGLHAEKHLLLSGHVGTSEVIQLSAVSNTPTYNKVF